MILADLEVKLEQYFTGALGECCAVDFQRSWGTAAPGEVFGAERRADAVKFAIAATGPVYETYLTPTAEITVALAVACREELFPDRIKVVELAGIIERSLLALQLDMAGQYLAGISSESFRVDGVRLSGALTIERLEEEKAVMITCSFNVKGQVALATTTQD